MNYLQLTLLALLSIHLALVHGKPKIPLYIGKGYNILLGNPLSTEGIDPGYQHQVFDFTYNKNETTEDKNFLIPDGMSERKMSFCSFTTTTNEYRGTQTYQNQLKALTSIGGGFDILLVKAAFSASFGYERISNLTKDENVTFTHATAECQSYEMSLNLFKPGNISDNFWAGVDYSLRSNDWSLFIEQFGTHFVYEVILGGRAVQEIQYDSKAISIMSALNMSIEIAAKASFASFYGDTSFNFSAYSNETKYASSLSKSIHEYYMGGVPISTNGTIKDWANDVIKAPMVISCKVLPLSNLFEFHPNGTFDFKSATTKYFAALDSYCENKTCRVPGPDNPRPRPATYSIYLSEFSGTENGRKFKFSCFEPITFEVTKIYIHSKFLVESIQIEMGDSILKTLSPEFGNGRDPSTKKDPWLVPPGEYISQVEINSGARIDAITFITNKGNKSPRYGGSGGTYKMITFPPGFKMAGISGAEDDSLVGIQFWLSEVHYAPSETPEIIKKELTIHEE